MVHVWTRLAQQVPALRRASIFATWPDTPFAVWVGIALAVFMPVAFYPFSRTSWLAWDVSFRPTEPGDDLRKLERGPLGDLDESVRNPTHGLRRTDSDTHCISDCGEPPERTHGDPARREPSHHVLRITYWNEQKVPGRW